MLIPVRISAVSDGTVITKGGDVVYIPVVNKEFRGTDAEPWAILEGEEICYANDPKRPAQSWVDAYVTSNLFNGASTGGDSWIPWWDSPNTYPITIVADMGAAHLVSYFKIEDTTDSQGAYLDYEIYYWPRSTTATRPNGRSWPAACATGTASTRLPEPWV